MCLRSNIGLGFSRPCVARGGFSYSLGRLPVSGGLGPGTPAGLCFVCADLRGVSWEIRFSSWRRPFELRKALPYVSKRAASFEQYVVGAISTAELVLTRFGLLRARVVWEKPRAHQRRVGEAPCTQGLPRRRPVHTSGCLGEAPCTPGLPRRSPAHTRVA